MSRQFLYLDSVIRQRIQSSPRSGLAISAYIHPKLTFKMYTSPGRKETSEAWSYSLLSMDSLLSSLFFSMRLYLGEMETWFVRSRSRYFRLLSPWMHYSFAMFFLAYKNKKKKRRRKRIGKERGQGCLFVNRESVITAKMCTGGDRWAKFPSNYSLGSQFVLYHQPEKNFSCVNREETTLFFIGRWPRWRAFVYEPLCFLRSSLFFSPLFCNAKHPLIKSMEPQQAKWNCSLCHFIPIILDFENLFLVVMLFYRKPKAS